MKVKNFTTTLISLCQWTSFWPIFGLVDMVNVYLLKTYLGYSPIEIYDPKKKWQFLFFFGGGVVLFFLTILLIRYEHINLQDSSLVYLRKSKIFIELAGSFRLLPATSKSQNTPFYPFLAKNSLFWGGSRQFSFLSTFTIWYRFMSLQTQIYIFVRWSKKFYRDTIILPATFGNSKVKILHSF